MDRRSILRLGLGTSAALAFGARAQRGFPERPLRLVVPFPAGGPYDVIGRMYARKIGDVLGQPMIVENRPGGETSIGAADVAHARPDGYSLLFGGAPTHVFAPLIMAKPAYDPVKDFAQLAVTGIEPLCITVNSKFPARTLQDLAAMAKEKPGKYNYGDTAPSAQLAAELYKMHAGRLDIIGVPYKGFTPALQDLLAGHIQVLPGLVGSVSNYHQQGALRMLAVFAEKRLASLPDVPTAIEAGFPGLVLLTFALLCTSAGTPKPIVDQLYQATHKVLNDQEFVKFQQARGIEPVTDSTPETATQFVLDQIARLTPLINSLRRKS